MRRAKQNRFTHLRFPLFAPICFHLNLFFFLFIFSAQFQIPKRLFLPQTPHASLQSLFPPQHPRATARFSFSRPRCKFLIFIEELRLGQSPQPPSPTPPNEITQRQVQLPRQTHRVVELVHPQCATRVHNPQGSPRQRFRTRLCVHSR
ncbi:hypothetical protein AAZV13_15G109400 [Glycine max]